MQVHFYLFACFYSTKLLDLPLVVGTSESNNNPLDELYDNIYRRVKSFIIESKKFIEEKKMSTKLSKDTIAKAGLYALLSYGFVSNVSYITCLIISWVTHGKRTGLSPLAPGQWKVDHLHLLTHSLTHSLTCSLTPTQLGILSNLCGIFCC